ncbi:hypothetical protein FOQG_08352 [Fusarium oxysporum f. sp. raphani 54005]|uniref:Uncharacterized protein n=8 Tax=Fusarium oxysporum species complex TaxID=171631 RepID=X0CCI3_FUSOX|nr:hypothetical protein FOXG_18307 [Fusarium oxysporum f. sp. lycopersici 4287]XP_031065820.1 uncharacterized protein FOIG_05404 [Fusarium odoratissimum NRRL 54006]EXA49044.1 hypothetical protein FOVG_02346 [Fusarium oxysporum f. sp. pisi HDV247]EXK41124.1 hypothetical protein FOMG_04641 [Fusarium oxysporum f. sp. melonis 26406]EXK88549.1 hypothetical protein FOQG_08352 [Fusarium oxysporum f. sp. raphani 54005]EXL83126.1 hypothetical protein FOPG_04133 [Fusarium oxysporum f. sp. conglutinans r
MTLRYEFIAHRGCLWRICKMDSGLLKNGKLKNDQLQASSQRGAAKSKGRPDCQPKRKEDVKKRRLGKRILTMGSCYVTKKRIRRHLRIHILFICRQHRKYYDVSQREVDYRIQPRDHQ